MITKKDIKEAGLNPDYIATLGEAIMKEGQKNTMDFNYIREKTGKIERFIDDVIGGVERREKRKLLEREATR